MSYLIGDYGASWSFILFMPVRMNGGDYCIDVGARSRDPGFSSIPIALPFRTLRDLFAATRKLPGLS